MKKGFTLIELLVVLGIMGILAVTLLAIINPLGQIQKSNDARRKGDLESLQRALELYYQDNGGYPTATGYKILGKSWGSAWTPYIATLPKDPVATHQYVYFSPNTQTYYLYASLQRGKLDPQVCNGGLVCTNVPAGASCGAGAVCNYGISSPNVSP